MEAREDLDIIFEGLEDVIEKDLQKHKQILQQTEVELKAYREAVSHENKKKTAWTKLIGQGKFNDDKLKESLKQIDINIRHLSDKCKLAREKIKHNQLIIKTLETQLEDQNKALDHLAQYRKDHGTGD